jgi:hypothetical protein
MKAVEIYRENAEVCAQLAEARYRRMAIVGGTAGLAGRLSITGHAVILES